MTVVSDLANSWGGLGTSNTRRTNTHIACADSGNLNIESLQDSSTYTEANKQAGGSLFVKKLLQSKKPPWINDCVLYLIYKLTKNKTIQFG